jgi:hypothetical protein
MSVRGPQGGSKLAAGQAVERRGLPALACSRFQFQGSRLEPPWNPPVRPGQKRNYYLERYVETQPECTPYPQPHPGTRPPYAAGDGNGDCRPHSSREQ